MVFDKDPYPKKARLLDSFMQKFTKQTTET